MLSASSLPSAASWAPMAATRSGTVGEVPSRTELDCAVASAELLMSAAPGAAGWRLSAGGDAFSLRVLASPSLKGDCCDEGGNKAACPAVDAVDDAAAADSSRSRLGDCLGGGGSGSLRRMAAAASDRDCPKPVAPPASPSPGGLPDSRAAPPMPSECVKS